MGGRRRRLSESDEVEAKRVKRDVEIEVLVVVLIADLSRVSARLTTLGADSKALQGRIELE